MSRFTTELRYPIEQFQHDAHMREREYSYGIYQLIGLDEYPIFDETYRDVLNRKIIEHYYFREIGVETLARFRWYMRTRMAEIMPKYNRVYQSLDMIKDPITNRNLSWREVWELAETGGTTTDRDGGTTYGRRDVVNAEDETDYGRTEHRANGGKDTQLAGTTGEKVIHSDTPMNEISTQAVENGNYATDVTYTTREGQRAGETVYGGTTNVTNGGTDTTTSERISQASGTDTTNSEEQYTRALDTDGNKTHTDLGYDGTSPTALLSEFVRQFQDVDVLVINDLADLFMTIWE